MISKYSMEDLERPSQTKVGIPGKRPARREVPLIPPLPGREEPAPRTQPVETPPVETPQPVPAGR